MNNNDLYTNINLYDLDSVDEYISYLSEIDINEAIKFNRYFRNKKLEDPILNEMAQDRSQYISLCSSNADPVHFTIANIICLEDVCPEIINHWKHELLAFTSKLIAGSYNKSVKKEKLILILINEYADEYMYNSYSYMNSLVYENAMKDEIRKGTKSSASVYQQKIAKYIKTDILPNIEKFVEPNKKRVSYLFDKLIEACKKSNVSIFENAINTFINWEVNYNEEEFEDFNI